MHIEPPAPKQLLCPQEQLAVSLYMKSMNKSQAARDAGYASTYVFEKPHVQAEIAQQMQIRADRLRIGADWVLMELKKCYDTSVSLCDMKAAMRALELIGRHTDIQAWSPEKETASDSDRVARLMRGRQRALETKPELPALAKQESVEPECTDTPPVCFMTPPPPPVDPKPEPEFEPVDETDPLPLRARELIARLREPVEIESESMPPPVNMRDREAIDGTVAITGTGNQELDGFVVHRQGK